MKAVFTFLLLVSLFQNASSQNHDFYWPMGYSSFGPDTTFGRTVIDFNTDPPHIYREDRELNFSATVASFCDSLGNLLVYTNGIRIVDREHNLLENGDSINVGPFVATNYESGYRLSQSAIFMLKPENQDTLTLFHESNDFDNVFGISRRYLSATKIDLKSNDGLGSVVSKNGELLMTETSFGGIRAVKHANGRDWWIINSFQSQNKYNRFYLSPEGMVFMGETVLEPEFPFLFSSGYTAFSPDGNKFARYYIKNGVYIYDFDRCNGAFENPVFIPMPNTSLGGGISFSPNSRFLYIASAFEIFQFDLWADDIGASLDTVAVFDGFQAPFNTNFLRMQLGPDGKIYINTTSSANILHVIQYPDKKGAACEAKQHGVQLPTYNAHTLPNFPNYRLGPLDGSPCDTLGLDNHPVAKYRYEQDTTDYQQIAFTDLSYYEPAEWHWDFGDNTTSQDTSPVHTFFEDGTYEVCLTVGNINSEDTFCRTLELGTVSSTEEAAQVDITVFPNPCREGVNIILGGYLPKAGKVVLYDAVGQRHKVQSLQTGWNTLRMEGLRAGVYFYEIWENGVLLESGKLVKVE